MKKKILKTFVSTIMVFAISMSLCVNAFAAHTTPTGDMCYNSTFIISHPGPPSYITSLGSHTLSTGETCLIYGYTYYHTVRCTYCQGYEPPFTKSCTVGHDKCPNYWQDCSR